MERPECQQQRSQSILSDNTVEQDDLKDPTEREHHWYDHEQRGQGTDARCAHDHTGQIGPDDDQIAMGDVDHAHDPDAQAQAKPEQRVKRPQHQSVQQRFRGDLHHQSPKYAADTRA
ncbi:hypothetical protein ACVWZ4_005340 [Bradyrhizobium sp. USDA 4472]